MRLRWPAGLAVLTMLLAATGSTPKPTDPRADKSAAEALCLSDALDANQITISPIATTFAYSCERADGTTIGSPPTAGPSGPAPTDPVTGGYAGCVTGPTRPVVQTALTSVSANGEPGRGVAYEYEPLQSDDLVGTSGSSPLVFGPGDLAPGVSYRWRAHVDNEPTSLSGGDAGWSPWCEFTVSASAVDYRPLGDVSLDALNELGVRPDRSYSVTLTTRQQYWLRDSTDIGHTTAHMTLTGPRWTDLLCQLTETASGADDLAAGLVLGDPSGPGGTPYRTLISFISQKLGGPPHPHLE